MPVSRRSLLGLMIAAPFSRLLAQEALRPETANVMLGPFYPQMKPLDQDADLTIVRGFSGRADGQVIHVSGRIVNRRGEGVRNARIEIWQANAHGRYAHDSDPNTRAPIDPNFQGYAVLKTDDAGRYAFKTIKPGPYPAREGTWMRAPHIHFDVQGHVDRKVTQMWFPGEKLNDQDRLLDGILRNRQTVFATVVPSPDNPKELLVTFDIVLAQG